VSLDWQFRKRGLPCDSRFKAADQKQLYYAAELSANKGGHMQSSSPFPHCQCHRLSPD